MSAPGDNWHCTRIDPASIGRHRTLEYDMISPDRTPSRRWIDPELAFLRPRAPITPWR
jgi:hypothetical protein